MSLVLRGGHTPDGRLVDVTCDDGIVTRVAPGGAPAHDGAGHGRGLQEIVDLTGYLLLAAPADPHAHLDKALTADRVVNPTGDLMGAVVAMAAHLPTLPVADFVDRAHRAALLMLAQGTTAIRTHVDLGPGLRGLEALSIVRDRLAGLLDLQLAVLPGPLTGAAGADGRALLRDALALADVVGGCPALDPDPVGVQRHVVEVAGAAGLAVDLHQDETLDPATAHLDTLAELATGFPHGVVAGHCVSLGVQPARVQRATARRLAAAGVGVITLPQTNLFLQARGITTSPPRGLTAISALREAGVLLAGGGDNLRDPFNPAGRGDALETASLLVTAGHLSAQEAYGLVSAGARAVMGLPPVSLVAGSPAEFLAVRAATLGEAVAAGPPDRLVVHRGRVVSRTQVTSWVAQAPSAAGRTVAATRPSSTGMSSHSTG